MPELHLWDPKAKKYSACDPFTKHTQRISKFLNTGLLSEIYKDELVKACFGHDAAYNKHKDLKNRTQSDIVLKSKAYEIATDPKIDGFQSGLASMVWKCFDKRSKKALGSGIENKQLADELHKPIIRKSKRRKVYSSFRDDVWGVDLADMTLISKFNKGIKYLLCVIDLFSRYSLVVGLKDKKGATVTNAFQNFLDKSKRKPNKIWVDHGSEFYDHIFKIFLKENDIEMYSTLNEGKSVVAERFIKTLKNKIYKHMTTIGKNDLNDKRILGSFYKKELQETDQKEVRIEKVIKKKGDKLFIKWKGYNNSFNSWIDKKDLA